MFLNRIGFWRIHNDPIRQIARIIYDLQLLIIPKKQMIVIILDNQGKDLACQLGFHQPRFPYPKVGMTYFHCAHTSEDWRGLSRTEICSRNKTMDLIRNNNETKTDMTIYNGT